MLFHYLLRLMNGRIVVVLGSGVHTQEAFRGR